jgi:hypothetical protein
VTAVQHLRAEIPALYEITFAPVGPPVSMAGLFQGRGGEVSSNAPTPASACVHCRGVRLACQGGESQPLVPTGRPPGACMCGVFLAGRLLSAGPCVRQIHVRLQRHELRELPEDDEGVAAWCRTAFVAKVRRPTQRYRGSRDPGRGRNLNRQHGPACSASCPGLASPVLPCVLAFAETGCSPPLPCMARLLAHCAVRESPDVGDSER